MIKIYIRIDFEDGYTLEIEKEQYEYDNSFEPHIAKHGNIVYLTIQAYPTAEK